MSCHPKTGGPNVPNKTTVVTSTAYCLSLQNSLAMPVHVVHALSHAGFGLRHHLQLIQHLTAEQNQPWLCRSAMSFKKLQNSNVPKPQIQGEIDGN